MCGSRPSDPDHIKTVGASGNDEESNLWPQCRKHHWERHFVGLTGFVNKYPKLKKELADRGFEFDELSRRWLKV